MSSHTNATRDFEKHLNDVDYETRRSTALKRGHHRVSAVAMFRHFSRSKYMPHQGEQECARRRRQMASA